MLPTTNTKSTGKKSTDKKTADKKKNLAQRNGQLARRKSKNRFIGATEAETDQRVEEYNRFLEPLSDEEMDRELGKLSSEELHLLAWITTYYQHNKRRKRSKK